MEMTKSIKEIIKLLSNGCIVIQSLQDKYWIEKDCEIVRKLTKTTFQKLQELQIITSCRGNAYCRFEFQLIDEFKST